VEAAARCSREGGVRVPVVGPAGGHDLDLGSSGPTTMNADWNSSPSFDPQVKDSDASYEDLYAEQIRESCQPRRGLDSSAGLGENQAMDEGPERMSGPTRTEGSMVPVCREGMGVGSGRGVP
jgi:hypothetical protein